MKRIVNLSFLLPVYLLLAASCAAQGQPVAPLNYSQYGRPPVRARALLLVPEEFERFVYVSLYEGREIRHQLGWEAERELKAAFGIEFTSVEVWPVRSEAEAMAMLSPNDPDNAELREYDYAVIPKFLRVDSTAGNQQYGFDIDLLVELYSRDGSTVTKVKGHGESSTGKYIASTPEDGARLALQYAVSAILDGIEGKRDIFDH